MPLYVKFAEEKRPKSVLKFLEQFYSRTRNTYYCQGHITYHNKQCTKVQDSVHVYRSFDDLLELVQTYYPSISHIKLMHYLLVLKIDIGGDKLSMPHLGTCNGMGKIRYIPYAIHNYPNTLYLGMKMDNSKYTWKQLLEPLGIFNQKEFVEYIKKIK